LVGTRRLTGGKSGERCLVTHKKAPVDLLFIAFVEHPGKGELGGHKVGGERLGPNQIWGGYDYP